MKNKDNHASLGNDALGLFQDSVFSLMRQTQAMQMTALEKFKIGQVYFNGLTKYGHEFMTPFWIALQAFLSTEQHKLQQHPAHETLRDYLELLQFNIQIAGQGLKSSLASMQDFHTQEFLRGLRAWVNTVFNQPEEDVATFLKRQYQLLEKVVYEYPQAIKDIESEYGFHFDDGGYEKFTETERFTVYRVLPQKKVKARSKPILIIPPYVLGANILGFLPGQGKSYVHAYANQGIPTYIRVLKPIDTTPEVQSMTGEDDANDTQYICEKLKHKHQQPVTLNGFCQGGFIAVCNLASGVLDGLVDALITCVAPIDGTRSTSFIAYLEHLPPRFRDLGYAIKELPSGNHVVDGKVMSWVYKLKSMEREAPVYAFYRDLMLFNDPNGQDVKISKTAAALNHWLLYDRSDIPVAITQMSFDSYTIPIDKNGTLPVKLFGRKLNIKSLAEKNIAYLICYAQSDDLVDKKSALAPLDFIEAEVTVFPKGHGAIATSWSAPDSEYALHKRYPEGTRGPVRYQMDLDDALPKGRKHG